MLTKPQPQKHYQTCLCKSARDRGAKSILRPGVIGAHVDASTSSRSGIPTPPCPKFCSPPNADPAAPANSISEHANTATKKIAKGVKVGKACRADGRDRIAPFPGVGNQRYERKFWVGRKRPERNPANALGPAV